MPGRITPRFHPRGGPRSITPTEPVTDKDIARLKETLFAKREQLIAQITALKTAAVEGSDSSNWEEDGTDAFNREFALKMAGSGNMTLNQIDESLRRIGEKTYGVCDLCEKKIGRLRMEALPFCKTCIDCQSESEADRAMYGRITV